MSRLQTTDGLTEEQHELIKLVREFVDVLVTWTRITSFLGRSCCRPP